MFECMYGYTPFACKDRHDTKMKILKHKSTFNFPRKDIVYQPSYEAMDVMVRLIVDKEKRLCSRKYRINDYTTQLIAGRPIKFVTDKHHKNYEGYFVYPDDAEDLKRHPFFNGIPWDTMLDRRPPFRPNVSHWEDTKYFEEDNPVSDIDEASSEAETSSVVRSKENNALISSPGSKTSQHQQEDQHIIPSVAIKPSMVMPPNMDCAEGIASPAALPPSDGQAKAVMDSAPPAAKKHKEKKRARDKILRDPDVGSIALELRRERAFMGYAYSKPKRVEDLIDEVMDAHNAEWHIPKGSAVTNPPAETVPV